MSPLRLKSLRDLRQMRGQVLTIAAVIACGVAAYVATKSAYLSLVRSQQSFYEEQRFADAFVRLRRAPLWVALRLSELEGVDYVEARLNEPLSVLLPELSEPASGEVLSLPEGEAGLNALYLRRGRMPEGPEEAVVNEGFAEANGIEPGEALELVMNGSARRVRITGLVVSPEYVFVLGNGTLAGDPRRYGVFFMQRRAVAAAYDMEGAFNEAGFRLEAGASEAEVHAQIDRVLAPYGGFGAFGRGQQTSHWALSQEMAGLEDMATTVPPIFLLVAAFLLNVVLSRIIQLQRPQIAALKALGYSGWEVGLHYLEQSLLITGAGAGLGLGLGAWMGSGLLSLYEGFFRFPSLTFTLDRQVSATAVIVSLATAAVGAAFSVRQVISLPPAEAMRPPAPPTYKRGWLDRLDLGWMGTSARMVLREIQRRPVRLLISSLGISMAVAILVVGRFFGDAMDFLIEVYMHRAMAWDAQVAFVQPVPDRAVRALGHAPGVTRIEGVRVVPAEVRAGHRERTVVIRGLPPASLERVLDETTRPAAMPEHGLMVSRKLAEILAVGPGDDLEIELREGDRRTLHASISSLVNDSLGLNIYLRKAALHELLGEEPVSSLALARADDGGEALIERTTHMSGVASVTRREGLIRSFREQSGENTFIFTMVFVFFACTIAIGVVYNNARVMLSARSRDLASLRVLGFTRAEISGVLLGELAVQVLLAIPVGLYLGSLMAEGMAAMSDPERFRLPLIISTRTYAFATAVTLAAGLASALLVRRKLDQLDLIAVLKTRE